MPDLSATVQDQLSLAVIFLQLGTEKSGNLVLRKYLRARSLGEWPAACAALRCWRVFGLRGVEGRGRVCGRCHSWLRALETQL